MNQTSDNPTAKTPPPTQLQRWMVYGTNVAVLIVATLVIVTLVNWLGHSRYYKRIDFTNTRRYSLSDQTLSLIRDLPREIEITTLYNKSQAPTRQELDMLTRVEDLLEEYVRRGGDITVRQIDPATDVLEYDAFVERLSTRVKHLVGDSRDAIGDAVDAYGQSKAFVAEEGVALNDLLPKVGNDRESAELIKQLSGIFNRLGDAFESHREFAEKALDARFPDYAGIKTRLTTRTPFNQELTLTEFSRNVLAAALDHMRKLNGKPTTSNAMKDAYLGMIPRYEKMKQRVDAALSRLSDLETGAYEQMRSNILADNSVVLMAGEWKDAASAPADLPDVVVLRQGEIYPNARLFQMNPDEVSPTQGYRGEEAVTGALVQLTLDVNTHVVFINPSPMPALSRGNPQTTYNHVADRLRKLNVKVTEWQPTGRPGPGGAMLPAGPRPKPRPGEKMAYVILPAPPPNPQAGIEPMGNAVADILREHVGGGHPAVVIVPPTPLRSFGDIDPVVKTLQSYGVEAVDSRLILRESPGRDGKPMTGNSIAIDTESLGEHPVAQTAAGLRGVLLQAIEIKAADDRPADLRTWPIVRTPGDTWSDNEYIDIPAAKRDDSDPTGPFTVMLATELGSRRMVVVGDRALATDFVANLGPRLAGTDVVLSRSFPANAELFVNSVLWSAGLDNLIAPSAGSQDIERIGTLTPAESTGVTWFVLVFLPLICLASGLVVWVVRRR